MRRTILVVVVLAVFGFVRAQGSEWEVVVYDGASGAFSIVTAGGVETLANVPPHARPTEDVPLNPIALSPDHRYAALMYGHTQELRLFDIGEAICCPPIGPDEDGVEYVNAAFSPDSRQVAVSTVAIGEFPYVGHLTTIDLATLTTIHQVSSDQFPTSEIAALELEWREDGIYFFPSCWGCEPPLTGTLLRWSPEDGQVVDTGEYYDLTGRRLDLTGEWVYGEDHPSFPAGSIPEFIAPSNVIVYRNGSSTEVVYFNPDNLELPVPRWVLDGRAFLLREADGSAVTLVYRDGRQQTLPIRAQGRFLAGTPDGWLMVSEAAGLSHYHEATDGEIVLAALGDFGDTVQLVDGTPLGATAGEGFAAIPIPEPITCPGALPSRLRANRFGRVLPGDANNLRAEPTTGSELIGRIPGEGFFVILEGPVCAEDYAWWRVDYSGTQGWTVEGTGEEYWVEPSG